MTIRAATYRRVSTTGQEDNTSLESQAMACARYAAGHGLEIIADYADVESGATTARTGLDALLRDAQAGLYQAVIVYHIDRLSRDVTDALILIRQLATAGLTIHDTTTGEVPREIDPMLLIRLWYAGEERRTMRRRLNGGLRAKAESGLYLGQGHICPFGYRYTHETDSRGRTVKTLEIVEDEAQVIRDIYQWYVHDGMSIRAIRTKLSELAIPTPRDRGRATNVGAGRAQRPAGQWAFSTVHTILSNSIYKGTKVHFQRTWTARPGATTGKKQMVASSTRPEADWVEVPTPAIIPADLWQAAQERAARNAEQSPRNSKRFYLLGRRISCGCGLALVGGAWTSRQGVENRLYRCTGTYPDAVRPCAAKSIRADVIEPAVWRWLIFAITPERIARGLEREAGRRDERRQQHAARVEALAAQEAQIAAQAERVKRAYVAGAFTLEDYTEEKARLDVAQKTIEIERQQLQKEIDGSALAEADAAALLEAAAALQTTITRIDDPLVQREIMEALDLRVTVELPDAEGHTWVRLTALLAISGKIDMGCDHGTCVLKSSSGHMEGSYRFFVSEDHSTFEAAIPRFDLTADESTPSTL